MFSYLAVSSSSFLRLMSFADDRFSWNNGIPHHTMLENGLAMRVTPTPHLDYWSRTFYDPLLVKHDGQCLLTPVAAHTEVTLMTAFTLEARAQFDQAGIMILVDNSTWVKAGIEYTDGASRLSCVVTNDGFSDWSTQRWMGWEDSAGSASIRMRVMKLSPGVEQGPTLVVEAAPWVAGQTVDSTAAWEQIRIGSLRSGEQEWRMGIFANSPITAAGCSATFHHILLGPKVAQVHNSDPTASKLEL